MKFASASEPSTWYHVIGVIACVMGGATAAGLTLGMLSLDPMDIQLKLRAGTTLEQEQAAKVGREEEEEGEEEGE